MDESLLKIIPSFFPQKNEGIIGFQRKNYCSGGGDSNPNEGLEIPHFNSSITNKSVSNIGARPAPQPKCLVGPPQMPSSYYSPAGTATVYNTNMYTT